MRPRPEGRGEPTGRPWLNSAARLASMRPRPEDRGEQRRPVRRPFRALQLQCGHGPKAVENDQVCSRVGWRSVEASMRPRPEDRGEPRSTQVHRATLQVAGLLQCGHGPKAVENSERIARERRSLSRFNAATARRPWRTYSSVSASRICPRASMRPRPEAVENKRTAVSGCRQALGFNAATARRPWRNAVAAANVRRAIA